jgi:hypothetical protein
MCNERVRALMASYYHSPSKRLNRLGLRWTNNPVKSMYYPIQIVLVDGSLCN